MSKIEIKGEFITKFQDKQFLYFADRSRLGIILIQRGHLLYYNKEFGKIFGYSQEEISKWEKREFYKIVHPEDLQKLVQNFRIEDNKTAVVQFRGITKEGKIIPIENSVCVVKYNDINAYLSTYIRLDNSIENNSNLGKEKIKLEIELDQGLKTAIDIISKAFNWIPEQFIQYVIKNDIKYIKDTLERGSFNDLRENYNVSIDINELKKIKFKN